LRKIINLILIIPVFVFSGPSSEHRQQIEEHCQQDLIEGMDDEVRSYNHVENYEFIGEPLPEAVQRKLLAWEQLKSRLPEIIESEGEGFFGYHATSTANYVMNESLRVIQEEIFGKSIPEDFYFFRAPDPDFYSCATVSEFFEAFPEKEISIEDKERLVHAFMKAVGVEKEVHIEETFNLLKGMTAYA